MNGKLAHELTVTYTQSDGRELEYCFAQYVAKMRYFLYIYTCMSILDYCVPLHFTVRIEAICS